MRARVRRGRSPGDAPRLPRRWPTSTQRLDTDDLVTGEAVALELPPASLGIRLISGLIDVIVEVVLLLVGFIAVGLRRDRRGAVRRRRASSCSRAPWCRSRPPWRPSPAGRRSASTPSAPAPCATTPARSPSTTRSSGPWSGSWRSGCSAACPPWSARWSAPGQAARRPTSPAPTSSATGPAACCPRRCRCPRSSRTGRTPPTSRRCPTASRSRSGSSSAGAPT